MSYAKVYIAYLKKQAAPVPPTVASGMKPSLPWHKNKIGSSNAERVEAQKELVRIEGEIAGLQKQYRATKKKKEKDVLHEKIKELSLKKNELITTIGPSKPGGKGAN